MSEPHEIFADLLNVEVNTIVKQSMTAEKMPALPFALLDIVAEFAHVLADAGIDLRPYLQPSREECWDRIAARSKREDRGQADDDEAQRDHIEEARATYRAVSGRDAPEDASRGGVPRYDAALFNCLPDLWPAFTGANAASEVPADSPCPFAMTRVHNGWDTFERLRIAALLAQPHLAAHHQILIARIAGSCSRLKYIIQGLEQRCRRPRRDLRGWLRMRAERGPAYATLEALIPKTRNELLGGELRHKRIPHLLRTEDLATVRKIWEVGTELVLVQTAVQIDGDVVTRISESLLSTEMAEVHALVLKAHHENVATGLSHWRALVEVAVELVTKVFGRRAL